MLSQSFGRITSTYSPLNYVGVSRSDASKRVIKMARRFTFQVPARRGSITVTIARHFETASAISGPIPFVV
jgi:hypothetical protein